MSLFSSSTTNYFTNQISYYFPSLSKSKEEKNNNYFSLLNKVLKYKSNSVLDCENIENNNFNIFTPYINNENENFNEKNTFITNNNINKNNNNDYLNRKILFETQIIQNQVVHEIDQLEKNSKIKNGGILYKNKKFICEKYKNYNSSNNSNKSDRNSTFSNSTVKKGNEKIYKDRLLTEFFPICSNNN